MERMPSSTRGSSGSRVLSCPKSKNSRFLRHQPAEVVERGLEQLGGVPQDGDVGRVHGQQPGHLGCVEAQVVTDDVEAHPGAVVLHLGALEQGRVEEVVPAVREGELESVLLPKAEEDVEQGAAGRLVGLHEHDVHLGRAARAAGQQRAVGEGAEPGWTVGAGVRHRNPGRGKDQTTPAAFISRGATALPPTAAPPPPPPPPGAPAASSPELDGSSSSSLELPDPRTDPQVDSPPHVLRQRLFRGVHVSEGTRRGVHVSEGTGRGAGARGCMVPILRDTLGAIDGCRWSPRRELIGGEQTHKGSACNEQNLLRVRAGEQSEASLHEGRHQL
ncbi:hypothetical protein EYF80_051425 [Liparis tanakae]|uniref:Uncharacterized protein n=1 Tax=Liparis tanakae TaxID=230148 RepID=A0A4Z2FBX1_9TELE|nr:hypothetical protein EYF80_051425 [Liparis tanakae]